MSAGFTTSTTLPTWLSLAGSAGDGVGMQQTDHSVQSNRQLFLTPAFIQFTFGFHQAQGHVAD